MESVCFRSCSAVSGGVCVLSLLAAEAQRTVAAIAVQAHVKPRKNIIRLKRRNQAAPPKLRRCLCGPHLLPARARAVSAATCLPGSGGTNPLRPPPPTGLGTLWALMPQPLFNRLPWKTIWKLLTKVSENHRATPQSDSQVKRTQSGEACCTHGSRRHFSQRPGGGRRVISKACSVHSKE